MQITTTKLIGVLKAQSGRYIERRGTSNELVLKDADGTEVLGPIPTSMVDDLEDQEFIKRDGLKYRPTGK